VIWNPTAIDYDYGVRPEGCILVPNKIGCWVMDYYESKRALEQNQEEMCLREKAQQ